MTAVVLREHQRIDRLALPDEAGWALARSGLVTASPARSGGTWQVTAKDLVGAARIGPVELCIIPKTPIDRLFFLLGYQPDWDNWQPGPVETRNADNLVAAVATAFARQTERALKQGPLRGYRHVDDALPTVRGRIREGAQIRRRFGFPLPVEVAYHDFTLDIPENRLLLTASYRLLHIPTIPQATRSLLQRIPIRLVGVKDLVPGRPLPGWTRTRHNARFHAALALAELILRDASPDPGEGGARIDGFILDMDKIFEAFVVGALADALGEYGGACRSQDRRHHLDAGRRIPIRPDLVWDREGGVPSAVADAKYKLDDNGRYPESDVYQMLAYCTRLGVPQGHLIYAAGPEPFAVHRIVNAGIEIWCHALDLAARPGVLLAQIAAIAAVMAAN